MNAGKVFIIGAGPGRADLLSVAGFRALLAADVILVDRLVPHDYLQQLGIPTTDKRIEKIHQHRSQCSQDQICHRLADHALRGMTVVRLKGGDPFVFGRGGDEFDYLASLDIDVEVIPGPTSATAVATAAGLPLTQHARGRSFAVVTARVAGGGIHQAFPHCDSLVILMGVSVLPAIVERLLDDGWPPDTPVAIVERGTLLWERRITGTVDRIVDMARRAHVASPAIIVVGQAACGIAANETRPRVLFTGLDPSNFRGLGELIHWPALQLEPNPSLARELPPIVVDLQRRHYDTIVFTDRVAVDAFFMALHGRNLDSRLLGPLTIVAMGNAVAQRLRCHSLVADHTIVAASEHKTRERPLLVVSGTHVPSQFVAQLDATNTPASTIQFHCVRPHPQLGRPLPPHDVIYFVSPAGVMAYWNTYGQAAFRQETWCLGDATQQMVADHGFEAKIVAPTPRPVVPTAPADC